MMGHRDRVNYSHLDVVMETYRSNIGSRLSNLYSQAPQKTPEGERLSNEFCFLTINSRLESRRKKTIKSSPVKISTRSKIQSTLAGNSAHRTSTSTADSVLCSTTSSDASIAPSKGTNIDLPQRRKLTFKDRLTQALFQKKHVCCRCKRRSKGCVRNKTFNGIEKHYTCHKCREASIAVKNLFDKHSGVNLNPNSSNALQNKQNGSQTPQGHYKDSGYETVTSCSTDASVGSTFTTSAKCSLRQGNDILGFNPDNLGVNDLDSTRTYSLSQVDESTRKSQPYTYNPCAPLNPPRSEVKDDCKAILPHNPPSSHVNDDCKATLPHNPPSSQVKDDCKATLPHNSPNSQVQSIYTTSVPHNINTASLEESSAADFSEIAQEKVNTYDGYLPDIYQNISCHIKSRKIIKYATTTNSSENDFFSFFPRMVKLQKCEKKSIHGQKACHICESSNKVFFRLPWEGGWVCEDCLDRLH